jgi:ATP-dependent protease ClpP protease subunit
MALYSTIQEIRRAGRTVNAHIQGTAMSAGSVLAQACDVRTIEPFASMMIHEACGGFWDKTSAVEDALLYQKRMDSMFCGIYASRSGKTTEYWKEKIARKDVYLTARESVSEGLVDRIRPVTPFPGRRERKKPSTDA